MSEELLLTFRSPPLPFFIESNRRTYQAGEEHPNRTNIGVFDMLFVHEGALHLAEGDNKWLLGPGDVLILRPDSYHYSYQPCQETTVFDWIHFQTVGAWEETEGSQSGSLRGDYYTYAIRLPKKFTCLTRTKRSSSSHSCMMQRKARRMARSGSGSSVFCIYCKCWMKAGVRMPQEQAYRWQNVLRPI